MNLTYMKNFITVVEAGGINKAARAIPMAQSALSHQIRLLEKETGIRLLNTSRGSHHLALTDGGWIFYRQARRMLELMNETQTEIDACAKGLGGTITISVVPSQMKNLVREVAKFSRKFPALHFRIHESYKMSIIEEVKNGISDFGITNAPLPKDPLFHVLGWKKSYLQVVGLPDWTEGNHTIPLSFLQNKRLAVSLSTIDLCHQLFKKKGMAPMVVLAADTREAVLEAVRQGIGWGLSFFEEKEPVPEGLACLSIEGSPSYETTLFKAKRRILSPAATQFLSYLEKEGFTAKVNA